MVKMYKVYDGGVSNVIVCKQLHETAIQLIMIRPLSFIKHKRYGKSSLQTLNSEYFGVCLCVCEWCFLPESKSNKHLCIIYFHFDNKTQQKRLYLFVLKEV